MARKSSRTLRFFTYIQVNGEVIVYHDTVKCSVAVRDHRSIPIDPGLINKLDLRTPATKDVTCHCWQVF